MNRFWIGISLLTIVLGCGRGAPSFTFLSKPYTLGSFHQKHKPTWEYVTGGETVENWITLITLIDRPDAHTAPDLDRLAEGIMQTYKTNGGQILLAKTMKDKGGVAFNYLVAAFEEPAKNRFELNFVKFGQGPKNAYIMIYGARTADGKGFLDRHSGEIGKAMENAVLPDLDRLPRREF